MDYSLAALKVVIAQLKDARQGPSQNAFTLGGILFQRVWLQGILVSSFRDGHLFLDDGTGIIELHLSGDSRLREWNAGMYVMAVGGYFLDTGGDTSIVKVHKFVDLSPFPYREAMWYLEVIEAYKLFYHPLIEEFV